LIFGAANDTLLYMNKRDSDWYIPPEARGLLLLVFGPMCFAVLSYVLLPVLACLAWLKTADLPMVYNFGLGSGLLGIVMLFVARLPHYKQRQFWTIGPMRLDRKHRRIYWLAYVFVAASLLRLGIACLR
jgi:hypothetical protein